MPLVALICSANTSSSQATAAAMRRPDQEPGQRAGQHDLPDQLAPAEARRPRPARGSRGSRLWIADVVLT